MKNLTKTKHSWMKKKMAWIHRTFIVSYHLASSERTQVYPAQCRKDLKRRSSFEADMKNPIAWDRIQLIRRFKSFSFFLGIAQAFQRKNSMKMKNLIDHWYYCYKGLHSKNDFLHLTNYLCLSWEWFCDYSFYYFYAYWS